MKYKEFGKTGVKVSRLGFGAMRLPAGKDGQLDEDKSIEVIRLSLDLGVNYLDSAWSYNDGQSEVLVGKAIKGYDRSKIYLSTKKPILGPDGKRWRESLETQLKRLDTDYIDFYHFHILPWQRFQDFAVKPGGPLDEAHRALSEGIVRHLSFSSHDTPENIIRLIDTGEFSTMLLQYNLLFRLNETAIAHAAEKGMGVAIMGPVMGGRLVMGERMVPSGRQTVPNLSLRFVLSNPNVTLALSGMSTPEMVRENAATADGDPRLESEDLQDVEELLQKVQPLRDLYCTGCGYCMPCPNGVDIPGSLLIINYTRLYQITGNDRRSMMVLHDTHPGDCVECGVCLDKCPQNIPIPDKLKEAVEILES